MTRTVSLQSGFEQRLLTCLRRLGVRQGQRLTVGFSGGYDSLALASALGQVQPVLRCETLLVHVDHRLRSDSREGASACERLARDLGLPFEMVTLNAGLTHRASGLGLEEAARRERYVALARAAASWDSSTLLLGHQANDQVETLLLHLFRGSGLDGLGGMRLAEKRHIPWWGFAEEQATELMVMRPLLAESRAQVAAYVDSIGLQPIQDGSNDSDDFDRNWVRHHVLPYILQRWPAAIETMQRSSQALALDRDLLNTFVEDACASAELPDRTVRTDVLEESGPAMAHRIIRRWLQALHGADANLQVVERLYDLVCSRDETRTIELGGHHRAVLAGGALTTFNSLLTRSSQNLPIMCASHCPCWRVEYSEPRELDDAIVEAPAHAALQVRTLQPGDCWSGSSRPVKEDLRLAGLHPLLRPYTLALVADDDVLLIPAIYPTIRGRRRDGPVIRLGVRWSKQP